MKKIIGIFVWTLLITIILPITVTAGDETNPEIADNLGDTRLSLLDIDSAWFYEKEDDPEYLFIAMKIFLLKENYNAVFSISFTFNGNDYAAGLNTFNLRAAIFRCGLPKHATYWQWNRMPKCKGIIDSEKNVITWKIKKSSIGNLQSGDVLTNTKANAVPGFPLSLLYFILQFDYRDFAPDNYGEHGLNYVVQY